MFVKRWKRSIPLVVLLALSCVAALAAAQEGVSSPQFVPIATGLPSPRHLDFDADGTLYVAEAGAGGELCVGEGEAQRCIGASGGVTTVTDGVQARLVDDMVSLALPDGSDTTGPHDIAWDDEGNLVVLVGLGNDPAVRDESGPLGPLSENFGQLAQVAEAGTWTNIIDISAHETANNPDEGEIDSNPYAIERVDGGYLVADAGANALLHVTDGGTITTVAVFPPRMVEFPPGSGDMMPMQAVPTSVDVGPDGAYYVGQLTGFPFPPGGANVYRVEEGEEPEVFADGFTNIIDVAFDDDGNLYVVELAANGLLSGDPAGKVTRIDAEGNRMLVADSGLAFPGGIAIGDDGFIYLTTWTVGGPPGDVVRLAAEPTYYLPIVSR